MTLLAWAIGVIQLLLCIRHFCHEFKRVILLQILRVRHNRFHTNCTAEKNLKKYRYKIFHKQCSWYFIGVINYVGWYGLDIGKTTNILTKIQISAMKTLLLANTCCLAQYLYRNPYIICSSKKTGFRLSFPTKGKWWAIIGDGQICRRPNFPLPHCTWYVLLTYWFRWRQRYTTLILIWSQLMSQKI